MSFQTSAPIKTDQTDSAVGRSSARCEVAGP